MSDLMQLLTSRGFTAVGIPIIILALSAMVTRVIKNEPFKVEHWLLAINLAFTSLCLCFAVILEDFRAFITKSPAALGTESQALMLITLLATLGVLIYLMGAYQTVARRLADGHSLTAQRVVWLNLAGGAPLGLALWILRG